MFGFGKKKIPTGAREKVEIAKQMRAAGRYNVNQVGGSGDTYYPSQVIAVTIIYALATIISMFLSDSNSNPLSGMHLTGSPVVDQFITGTNIEPFTGNEDEDRLFTILGRGMAFFIVGGIVPGIAFVAERLGLRKRVIPLVICWGVIITLMLLYLCVPEGGLRDFGNTIRDMVHSI